MNDFMRKPINYEALDSRVDLWLEGHTQRVSMPPSDKVEEAHADGSRGAEGSPRGTLHEPDARHQQLQSTLAANYPTRAAKELNARCGTY